MLKLVGKVDIGAITKLGRPIFDRDDRDFTREEVAVDACTSVAANYINFTEADGRTLQKAFADLIRSTKRQFVDAAYDEAYVCSEERDDGSVLVFRNVTKHRDIGFFLYKPGRPMERHNRVRASTFSIVLAGECTLHLHRARSVESVRLGPGDIYVFDQTVMHSVTDASEICVHLTTSIPKVVAESIKQTGPSEVQKIENPGQDHQEAA